MKIPGPITLDTDYDGGSLGGHVFPVLSTSVRGGKGESGAPGKGDLAMHGCFGVGNTMRFCGVDEPNQVVGLHH